MNKTIILLLVVLSVFVVGCSSEPEELAFDLNQNPPPTNSTDNSEEDTTDQAIEDSEFLTQEDESFGDLI